MASRNRKNMNASIFRRLAELAEAEGVELQNADAPRWLKTSGKVDQQFMAKADVVEAISLTRHQKVLLASFEGARTLILVGFGEIDEPPEGMIPTAISTGIFSLAVYALELESIASGLQIREVLELAYQALPEDKADGDRYKGHKVDELLPLFPPMIAFHLSDEFVFTRDVSRCTGLYLCRSLTEWPLEIGDDLAAKMSSVFESGQKHIPYNNLIQGMLSFTWQAFYLDVYRCIERLYLIPRVKKLAGDLKSSASLLDYCRLLETHLSWRPKEDEALKMLLSQCEDGEIADLLAAFQISFGPIVTPEDKNKATDKVTAAVYKLRNDIVHFRPANEIVVKPPQQWNAIISSLATCMQRLYEVYHSDLETGTAAAPVE